MAAIVVPFRGAGAKLRLDLLGASLRHRLALAMLEDVLVAAVEVGPTLLVTENAEVAALARGLGARILADPGGGQGAAVCGAVAVAGSGGILVVNADLPCATPEDLDALIASTPPDGLALVAAADGTTNALGLAASELFAPLYGPGSAERFRAHAVALGRPVVDVSLPNLAGDVDTAGDLERLADRLGSSTRAMLPILRRGLAA